MKISLVGLGKLGLPLISCFAKAGYETLGIDIDQNKVNSINSGISPIQEPDLQDLISEFGGYKLKATVDHAKAIQKTDVTFILTSTPSKPDGSFSNCYLELAITSLAKTFANIDKDYHLFVISSTVIPGSICSFISLIEKYSAKKLNKDFGIAFDPDFVALGQVIKDFLNPDFVLIGESHKKAGDIVESIHEKMCENNPKIFRMSIINAELAKICLNTYITLKISFANSIANLCEKVPGADCDVITKSIGQDKRISPYYFSGGLAFGGPCFPRDTKAFINISDSYDEDARLIKAIHSLNEYQHLHLLDVVLSKLRQSENKIVGIMGLAFKEGTPAIVGSPAITLINYLLKNDVNVIGYDPLSIESTKEAFGDRINYVTSPELLLEKSGIVVVTYRLKEFKEAIERFDSNHPIIIVDCWRIIDNSVLKTNMEYLPLGRWIEDKNA